MHYSINNAEVSIQDQQFYECAVKEFRLKLAFFKNCLCCSRFGVHGAIPLFRHYFQKVSVFKFVFMNRRHLCLIILITYH